LTKIIKYEFDFSTVRWAVQNISISGHNITALPTLLCVVVWNLQLWKLWHIHARLCPANRHSRFLPQKILNWSIFRN